MEEKTKVIRSQILNLLPNFKFIKRENLGELIFFENEDTIKGLMCYFKEDKLHNINLFFNEKHIQQTLNYEHDIYSNYTIDIDGHNFLFDKELGKDIIEHLPIDLTTEQDLERACELISKYIKEVAEPFFAYWQDIRSFLPFLETDDSIYINDMFCGDDVEKKIIIWKLCNHPKFQEFVSMLIDEYETYLKDNPYDKLKETLWYKENERWVKWIKNKGYDIYDLGDNPGKFINSFDRQNVPDASAFYDMEKMEIFKNK